MLPEGLYAITPDWGDTARLVTVTEAILKGGCRILQYRNKATTACHRDEQAAALRGLTRRYGALLIVNDDIELAEACAADGVHLGGEDGDLAEARKRIGPARLLGASCYQSLDLAEAAAGAGADYVAFGSFYASPTKPLAKRADPGLIGTAKARTGLPVCAIGGIDLGNAAPLVAAGANLLAVISAVYNSPDPERASRDFTKLFETHRP
ncbi:thiamine phosphate synthase [Parasulfuritortus cantonensis]|uniref:Thiamine-phosphate synthase n=1 Tax=Parasulfuritortus cantonensis TaxID=2528202 RepID=A0A4R1BIW8_9PROT|nr:thiamine phosphate synthase [Parasulfuritortus cantonensis]TCJ17221.1 thiamine phosphate synthase [Parasulfuritortus cantonensis]